MLWTVIFLILVLWFLGFIGEVGGGFIHTLLVVALIIFIIQVITSRK